MSRCRLVVLGACFVVTGATALSLQVVWHRVLTTHAGVDLGAATTVVVAFLAGLALGNLAGGRLADGLSGRGALAGVALAELGVAVFAIVSVPLLSALPDRLLPADAPTLGAFFVYAVLLLVPTVLMGATIPLTARALQVGGPGAQDQLGRLYGVNALGASLGAVGTGWYLLGTIGSVGAARLAGAAGAAAAAAIWLVSRRWADGDARRPVPAATNASPAEPPRPITARSIADRTWPWVLLYGLSGAVAIGLQQVFFRLVDTLMRSNAYTFSITLGIYLACFGLGSVLGSRLGAAVTDSRRWFLGLQVAVALGASLPVVALTRVLPGIDADAGLSEWLAGPGFRSGFGTIGGDSFESLLVRFAFALPLLVMGPAVLAMGISFPLAQRIVTEQDAAVGRRTGDLLAANTVGNVVGGLATTFVFIDLLGSAGTMRLLCGVAAVGAVVGLLVLTTTPAWATGLLAAPLAAALVALPGNTMLWQRVHGATQGELVVAEDRTCVSAMDLTDDGAMLSINGAEQNGYPFDDFHVLIGLLPALTHPAPAQAVTVGLGIGSTTYGVLADPRLDLVRTAELCGGNIELIEQLRGGRTEFGRLVDDPRQQAAVLDGRALLRSGPDGLDLVVVDTLLPQSASSGNTYSREFYELVADRLAEDGLFAQWVPSARSLETAAAVFPHVVTIDVPSYDSTFLLASRSPIAPDAATLVERFDRLAASSFEPAQRDRLRAFFSGLEPTCIRADTTSPAQGWNLDMVPRDEFFLNHPTRPPSEGIDRLRKDCDD